MRGLNKIRSLRTVAAGHTFVQNLRRGHYAITVDTPVHDQVRSRSPSSHTGYNSDHARGTSCNATLDRTTQQRRLGR